MNIRLLLKYCTFVVITLFLAVSISTYIFSPRERGLSVDTLLKEANIVPVVVLGSGPAGLSASLFTSRASLKTLVISGKEECGQLTEASYVENWPGKEKQSGLQLMQDLKKQAEHFGMQMISTFATKVDFSAWPFTVYLDNGEVIKALALIIATGGSQRTLSIPGVKEYWGKGIGICTICDAPFDKGKEVAVIGGGDAAADKALQLSAFAKRVTLLVRDDEMRAAAIVQQYVNDTKNIVIRNNVEVLKIVGEKGKVSGIELRDAKTGATELMPLQSIYFALGFTPNSALFQSSLRLDKEGYIKIEPKTQKTSVNGVFAAGTVEDSRYQKASISAGAGVKAGLDAIEFLQKKGFTQVVGRKLEPVYYKTLYQGHAVKEASTKEELDALLASNKNVLIKCYTHVCPVCSMIAPCFEQASGILQNDVTFVAVDLDKIKEVTQLYSVDKTPTFLFMQNGKVKARSTSLLTQKDIVNFAKNNLK